METSFDPGRFWKTILDTVTEGLIIIDRMGKIVAVNPAAEKLTGYTQAELIHQDCRILNCDGCVIHDRGPGEKWCRLFEKGRVRDKLCQFTHKDRRTVQLLKSGTVLRDENGEAVGVVETLTDMSQVMRQREEIQNLRQTYLLDAGYHGIIGKSPIMRNLMELIGNVAQSGAPVMITGESGTGKELVARAIHEAGPRRDKPFIKVNCAALNDNLLESELFGHVKGAFTGADRSRVGRFEAAHEGTIFLDEIGDLPRNTQIKLLRVLEDKKIERVGDHKPVPVDVRIITATHKDLEALVRKEEFREDLYFRIHVFPLHCPPLADRSEDIPMIALHFIRQNARGSGKAITGLSPGAMEALIAYRWPGNVRELRNAIDYAFVLCPEGVIGRAHLPGKITAGFSGPPADGPPARQPGPSGAEEKNALARVLRETGWNQSAAARKLGVSRITVWKRMKKFNIQRPEEF